MADTPIYDRLLTQLAAERARRERANPELFTRLMRLRCGGIPVVVLDVRGRAALAVAPAVPGAYPCCGHCDFDDEIVHNYPCPSCQWRAPQTDEKGEADASR